MHSNNVYIFLLWRFDIDDSLYLDHSLIRVYYSKPIVQLPSTWNVKVRSTANNGGLKITPNAQSSNMTLQVAPNTISVALYSGSTYQISYPS